MFHAVLKVQFSAGKSVLTQPDPEPLPKRLCHEILQMLSVQDNSYNRDVCEVEDFLEAWSCLSSEQKLEL